MTQLGMPCPQREGEPWLRSHVPVTTGIRAGRKDFAMSPQDRAEHEHDKTLEDSFPASDPPANSGITGAGAPGEPAGERGEGGIPTGHPTSDRHATETAHQTEDEVKQPAKR
jgi:hypothetical protein